MMSPLGKRILAAKRNRAISSRMNDHIGFWGITLLINSMVNRAWREDGF